jgi:hypothetical protein
MDSVGNGSPSLIIVEKEQPRDPWLLEGEQRNQIELETRISRLGREVFNQVARFFQAIATNVRLFVRRV